MTCRVTARKWTVGVTLTAYSKARYIDGSESGHAERFSSPQVKIGSSVEECRRVASVGFTSLRRNTETFVRQCLPVQTSWKPQFQANLSDLSQAFACANPDSASYSENGPAFIGTEPSEPRRTSGGRLSVIWCLAAAMNSVERDPHVSRRDCQAFARGTPTMMRVNCSSALAPGQSRDADEPSEPPAFLLPWTVSLRCFRSHLHCKTPRSRDCRQKVQSKKGVNFTIFYRDSIPQSDDPSVRRSVSHLRPSLSSPLSLWY